MGSFSIGHWLIVLAIVLILFGAGKLPKVMGDVAKGVKNFKAGLKDEEDEKPAVGHEATPTSNHTAANTAHHAGSAPNGSAPKDEPSRG
ncbi:twin-arginine translocase TatA/TatE family subunit [Marinivivus vitaminiproducens]|uniref:twin-arginine translocase TatA/TatE family subunit n=1 Tax=Marinivivus vitaminiproducens TaxID=3035935 RepID=UPI003F9FCA87